MKSQSLAFVGDPIVADEAEGVLIRRSIGSERLIMLDPFLLLDHLSIPSAEGMPSVGFPRHPHRGSKPSRWCTRGR